MTIRFLNFSEIKDIQNFLKENWRPSILDRNIDFFKWTYCRNESKNVDFVIEIDDITNEIISCLGFIQTKNFFNHSCNLSNTIWLTNWKTISKKNLSGIKILKFLETNTEYEMIGTIGCNKDAKNIYKALGYKTGNLKRYCALNSNNKKFKIISKDSFHNIDNIFINKDFNGDKKNKNLRKLKDIKILRNKFENIENKKLIPCKNIDYYINRYINHPIYEYQIYAYEKNNKNVYIVVRKCYREDSFALRIVDVIGDVNLIFLNSFEVISGLFEGNPEYIDMYFYSEIDIKKELCNGFFEISKDTNIIIPSYFEPFVYSNQEINFAYKKLSIENINTILFKGDCDQDRPS